MELCHYIIVRRDLPLGIMTSMVAHAAGESAGMYWNDDTNRGFRGCTVVILGVDSEDELRVWSKKILACEGTAQNIITEPDEPYNGQWMAIGVVPIERDRIRKVLQPLKLLQTLLDKPEGLGV